MYLQYLNVFINFNLSPAFQDFSQPNYWKKYKKTPIFRISFLKKCIFSSIEIYGFRVVENRSVKGLGKEQYIIG